MTQVSTLPDLAAGDDFTLLQMPRRFSLDVTVLRQNYLAGLRMAHPDRFAAAPAQQQRLAQQWSARINEAYARLADPVERAVYLCVSHGVDVRAAGGGKYLPAEMLMQQMAWREQLDDAQRESDEGLSLANLRETVLAERQRVIAALASFWDAWTDLPTTGASITASRQGESLNLAAALTCELIFIEQFLKRELKAWP